MWISCTAFPTNDSKELVLAQLIYSPVALGY